MLTAELIPCSVKNTSSNKTIIENQSICPTTETELSRRQPAQPQCRINPCQTTSFLTATALVYAIEAGITAAAGTRLALQSSSVVFLDTTHAFLKTLDEQKVSTSRRCLAHASIGQFARLLLFLDTAAVSQAPSPESNPNSPLPVKAFAIQYIANKLIGQSLNRTRFYKVNPCTEWAHTRGDSILLTSFS